GQRAERAGPESLRVLEPTSSLQWRELFAPGKLLQLGDRAVSDLAPRDVDDAPERHRVARVGAQAKVCQDVLHLPAVVEADAADEAVGNAAAQEDLLERARLRVSAVEDGALAEGQPLAPDQALDLRADRERLLAFVVHRDEPHRLAAAKLGPELLVGPVLVLQDHR